MEIKIKTIYILEFESLSMKKNLSVLVTGSNGFIGPLLVNQLLSEGYDVIGLDTNYFSKDCEFYPNETQFDIINRDVRDITEKDLRGVYGVCHLAGISNDPMGELNPDLTHEINYKSSIRLAKIAKEVGVERFVFSSSCSTYGIADSNRAMTEEDKLAPVTAYAKSKVLTEYELKSLGSSDYTVTSLRNATAFGVSSKLRLDIVVNNLTAWAYTTNKIQIMSDGSPWRPLVHAADIAQAFVCVLSAPTDLMNKEEFNVGSNTENYQIKDIAEIIKQKMPSCDITIGNQSPDSRTYQVNFDKIASILPDFKPKWTVPKGVDQLLSSYKENDLTLEKFEGRYFIRLNQIRYLLDENSINNNLYWN